MTTDYHVFKTILTGLELNLVGMGLFNFVQRSTGCTLEKFEQVYQQIQETWQK